MRVYVGVTDGDWHRFLASRPDLTEVNFWQPSGGRRFGALAVGEPFAFKTHYPQNRIVGVGFFSGFVPLRLSEAWDVFGEANGVSSVEQMRRRVGRYRKATLSPDEDPVIGCVMLRDTTFLPETDTLPAPDGWAPNIVQGKTYPAVNSEIEATLRRLLLDTAGADVVPGDVFGDPRLMPVRVGQQPFKALVLDAYHRRCAFTGERIVPVLQAAHIRPVSEGGDNRVDNGLLLRSDVHTLFDRGYLGVHPQRRELMVSPALRTEFDNGEEFYARAGHVIDLPERRANRPNREFLTWHADSVFKAS